MPLAARSGFGELRGLGDALWAWHGADFAEVNALLSAPPVSGRYAANEIARRARAYRQVLSLILAQRRPSGLLVADREALRELTDRHLYLLEEAGVIDARLRNAALATKLDFHPGAIPSPHTSFAETKGVDAVRAELLSLLGVPGTYELDRLDAHVTTTLDAPMQTAVRRVLADLRDPAGLGGTLLEPRLLARGDPSKVVYSFSLYERVGDANVLRAQVDTLDQPFNVNRGMKLDLGSTAKLRTLVHYLSLVSNLWDRWHALPGCGAARARAAPLGRDQRLRAGPAARAPADHARRAARCRARADASRRARRRSSSPAAVCIASRTSTRPTTRA